MRKAFEWSNECKEAFTQLKKYLASSPLLSKIVPREVLYLYLAVLITLDEEELSSALRLEFKTTDNEAEYEAVIPGSRVRGSLERLLSNSLSYPREIWS